MSYSYGDYAACLGQWMHVLREEMTPILYIEFSNIYLESINYVKKVEAEQKKVLSTHDTFHVLLSQVPLWNGKIIRGYADRMTDKIPKIRAILKNVCVSLIYVMSAVRIGSSKSSTSPVDVTIPALETFIHAVFEHCSAEIDEDVYLFDHKASSDQKRKNKKNVLKILDKSIVLAIRKLMNVGKVLDPYLQEVMEEKDYPQPVAIAPPPVTTVVSEAPPQPPQPAPIETHQEQRRPTQDDQAKAIEVKQQLDTLESEVLGEAPLASTEDDKKTIHIPTEMMKYIPQTEEIMADAPFDFNRWADEAETKV